MERLILFNFIAIVGKYFGHDQILINACGPLRSVQPSASCVFSHMNPEGFLKIT